MNVAIIDYGMSNLGSINNALIECGGENVSIISNPEDFKNATHIILPGVGSFKDGMTNLKDLCWIKPLRKTVIEDKVPLLGICLGMQLLADKGFEGGEIDGLGLIHGTVEKLKPVDNKEKIPHVGWNEIYSKTKSPILENIPDGTDYYFVHSYHFIPRSVKNILTTTPYCGNFVSSVISDNIFGTQFHPEKSQRPGFQLLKNFLNL
ncbi:TPA: imidazole glycerol phosphate synthase subunit HisH [Candidatus Berkelbacteria bacterium]|uniref:Imidazole glycerol phosphate synthase subunit HisH n=1 Tax=Berkelbacteria bacterium GW2011_GWE1_39_12 TaxID=1618337 RepID=A0A0G4B5B6_9BACT|nr:MAG: imidazole glycerol phosphate synthase subunit HisH, glutamine amidotransferase [Berkelbacteria bacterium GW2011_GWE1_39_12]HBO60780.1 imidazole glycerol phosphate synthase subunit HisH [Candidatus Berkelbacteria bacterium]